MKTLLRQLAIASALFAFTRSHCPAAESLSVLLQKAIYAEETEGNLDSAIKLYAQIKSEGATNRSLIAQAQYRLAVCYQKQGNKDAAIASFTDLVKQFPSETTLAQKAAEQLTALGQAVPDAVTLRKVAVVSNTWIRAVSPGGSLLAHSGDSGETLICELATRKVWEPVKTTWENSPWEVVFAPDERRIAYDLAGKTVFVANVDGSNTREVYKAGEKDTIDLVRWIAGADELIAVLEEKGEKSVVAIDIKAGRLKRFNLPRLNGSVSAATSDGRYLALSEGGGIAIQDVQSGRKETVVEAGASRGTMAWGYNDSVLFFSSDRTGNRGLWAVETKEGKAVGEATLVKEFTSDAYFADVTTDGRIYYAETNYAANVCVARVDFEAGKVLEEPRLISDRFPGTQTLPMFSKDGKKLWFAVQGEQRRFVAVSMASGKQEEFPVSQNFTFRLWDYAVSDDGAFLIVEGRKLLRPGGTSYTAGIHRYEVATGKVETVLATKRFNTVRRPRMAADGKSFYYARDIREPGADGKEDPQKRKTLIVRRDLHSDAETTVFESTGNRLVWRFGVEVSPDGSRLAYVASDDHLTKTFVAAIEVFDVATGQKREVVRMMPREAIWALRWTADGKRLVYLKAAPGENLTQWLPATVWSVALDTGKSVKLELDLPDIGDIAVAPEGQKIAFRTGYVGDTAQLWVMEGMRPRSDHDSKRVRKVIAKSANQVIDPAELKGPNNSIIDRALGVTAILPAGWSIRQANRFRAGAAAALLHPDGFTGIRIAVPQADVDARFAYHIYDSPPPLTPAQMTAWLQAWPEKAAETHSPQLGNIRNRGGTARTIGGAQAWSWSADFERNGAKWTGEAVVLRNENGYAFVFVTGPATEMDAVRPTFERFIETVRIEKQGNRSALAIPRMIVPVEDISREGHSVFDRLTGIGATLPAGWTLSHADRVFEYLAGMDLPVRIECVAAEHPDASLSLIFCLNREPAPSSENVNSWLEKWVETKIHPMRSSNPYVASYQLERSSFVSRSINKHPALTWTSEVTQRGVKTKELSTLVYSDQGVGYARLSAPAHAVESLGAVYEKFLESVYVP